MKINFLGLSLSILFLLTSCGTSQDIINAEKMKNTYMSNDYVIASCAALASGDGVFNYEEAIKESLGVEEVHGFDMLTLRQTKNGIISMTNYQKDGKDYFNLFFIDANTKELKLVDSFDTDYLVQKGLINKNFKFRYYFSFNSNGVEMSDKRIKYIAYFERILPNKRQLLQKVQFVYELETLNRISHSKTITDSYPIKDEYIEGGYAIKNKPDYGILHSTEFTLTNGKEEFVINEDVLLKDENYKKIREEIYFDHHLNMCGHIINEKFYLEAKRIVTEDSPSYYFEKDKNTVPMIFKVDAINKDVEYIGHLSLYTDLLFVFDKVNL